MVSPWTGSTLLRYPLCSGTYFHSFCSPQFLVLNCPVNLSEVSLLVYFSFHHVRKRAWGGCLRIRPIYFRHILRMVNNIVLFFFAHVCKYTFIIDFISSRHNHLSNFLQHHHHVSNDLKLRSSLNFTASILFLKIFHGR